VLLARAIFFFRHTVTNMTATLAAMASVDSQLITHKGRGLEVINKPLASMMRPMGSGHATVISQD